MQITNEEKARIFGAYIWSNVKCKYERDDKEQVKPIHPANMHELLYETKYCYLLLKPREQISDEDAIAIASIVWANETFSIQRTDKFIKLTANNDKHKEVVINIAATDIDPLFLCSYNGVVQKVGYGTYVEVLDKCRKLSLNIGYGSYTPEDLVRLGVVAAKI